jgi:purine nucleoside phosphorylase
MAVEYAKVQDLANALKNYTLGIQNVTEFPETAIILGSGLSKSFENSKNFTVIGEIGREKIDHMMVRNSLPQFNAVGHELRIFIVEEKNTGKRILAVGGRKHLNEMGPFDHDKAQRVVRIPRALIYAGIKNLIHTSAVGGISPSEPGKIILVTDHDGGDNIPPHLFSGVDNTDFGPYHFDCQNMYYQPDSEKLRSLTTAGILRWCLGPQFETAAQIRRFERDGIAGVGMSMLPETMAANQIKLNPSGEYSHIKNIGLGVVSNPAAGKGGIITDEDVKETTKNMGDNFTEVLVEIIKVI